MRENILNYLGTIDYISASHALHLMHEKFSPGQVFMQRGLHYNTILTSIRRLLASTWEEILQDYILIKHGNIWITDLNLFDKLYNLLTRMQAAMKFSRGIKIEMNLDPFGNLRLGNKQYWEENTSTVFENMRMIKGEYNLRIRAIGRDAKRIYLKPIMYSKEFKAGHSKDPLSHFYDYCKTLGFAGSCLACKNIKTNLFSHSCILTCFVATTSTDREEDLNFFNDAALETLLQFGLTGETDQIESILYASGATPVSYWRDGYLFTTDTACDYLPNQDHLQPTTEHNKRFCKRRDNLDHQLEDEEIQQIS